MKTTFKAKPTVWAALIMEAAGAVMLISVLWPSHVRPPDDWMPLNQELESALEQLLPKQEEAAEGSEPGGPAADNALQEQSTASVPQPVPESAEEQSVSRVLDGRIDLNRATLEQLLSLPGIGPVKAQAIIEDRSSKGQFRSIEEITRVSGIGSKIFERMKESIVVNP